ncbi:hypothetical protein OF001_U240022 [Pseudomonas sp. OF001]|nr:hypothetical protein OF001_U240022 [Pseudomonas sp. OF001]
MRHGNRRRQRLRGKRRLRAARRGDRGIQRDPRRAGLSDPQERERGVAGQLRPLPVARREAQRRARWRR